MGERILVVAAHPDDEILGMGGTIAHHTTTGDEVRVLFLTDGVSSRGEIDDDAAATRQAAARRACAVVGASIVGFGEFPDNAVDSVPLLEVVQYVEEAKARVDPAIVYTHHAGDLNIDHRRAVEAVLTACRPQPHERVREIYSFEVASSTEWSHHSMTPGFQPDTFVDVSAHVEDLLQAYRCYASEIREDPHARSVDALRTAVLHRGRQVGLLGAEAFMTLRRLIIEDRGCSE